MSPPGQAELAAARLLLARPGLSPSDLLKDVPTRPPAPTFAEYVPVVSAAVSDGTRRLYGSYWNRIVEQWGGWTSPARRRSSAWPGTSVPMWSRDATPAAAGPRQSRLRRHARA
jgi:hypothetical protein